MLVRIGKRLIRTEAVTETIRDGLELTAWLDDGHQIRLQDQDADDLEAFLATEAVQPSTDGPPFVVLSIIDHWHELPARRSAIEDACRLILKDVCGDQSV